MIALWYRNGALERAPFQDGRRRIWVPAPLPRARIQSPRLARRERRRCARAFSGKGRRLALPVRQWRPIQRWVHLPAPLQYDGHRLSDGRRDVTPYLSEGESVEVRHLADVKRWLAARGASKTS